MCRVQTKCYDFKMGVSGETASFKPFGVSVQRKKKSMFSDAVFAVLIYITLFYFLIQALWFQDPPDGVPAAAAGSLQLQEPSQGHPLNHGKEGREGWRDEGANLSVFTLPRSSPRDRFVLS